ncbi:uncharacterized protein LOC142737755 [Rhinoderma darwinii]|uniref:uncharacterized protein LOC142650586 n=1 Tax=Rhinoderma darwinii TaxID=43563 RepID=UPI003F679123
MTSSTFAFDSTTTANILAQVTNSGDFLRIPPQELRTRDYEKELRKYTSYDLHRTTLAEYHRLERIPRGLRSHLRPTLFSDDEEYCQQFQRILNKCSLDLILLTISHLQTRISESDIKIKALENQLSATLSPSEWENLKTRTDIAINDFSKTIQLRKRDKFQRDATDYDNNRVYRWNESSTYANSWRQPRQQTENFSSSGSDSSIGRRPPRFLGNRRGRNGPPGGRGGDGRGRDTNIQTRSQTR